VHIEYHVKNPGITGRIDITDATGRLIRQFTNTSNNGTIDLSFQSGIYFVRYTVGTNNTTQKLVVIK